MFQNALRPARKYCLLVARDDIRCIGQKLILGDATHLRLLSEASTMRTCCNFRWKGMHR